jgi:hypothetical protein
MAGNIGFYKRITRKLNVNTGSRLTDVSKLTRALPNAEGVSYYSGQPLWVTSAARMTIPNASDTPTDTQINYTSDPQDPAQTNKGTLVVADGGTLVDAEWRWTTTPVAGTPVYFAFQDSDEWDGSGKNMAVSTLDKFELQTPFYDVTKVYTSGMPLTVKAAAGTQPVGNAPRNGGTYVVAPAGEDEDIIGYVTAGVVNVSGDSRQNPVKVSDDRGFEAITGGPVVWTESSDTQTVLQFETAWNHRPAGA